jgi:hypothetical protein
MSTSAVNSTSINQQLQQYFQTRQSDLRQLGQALSSGNLTAAQNQFTNITALGESGPFAGGNAFKITGRQDDFNALGQALQSGDLAGAQQAFGALASTFKSGGAQSDPPSATAAAAPAAASSAGPEIIVNLSNTGSSSNPEQVTINIANAANGGGEQVSLSVGNQGSNPEQVTFNLAANSNEQIVLNLLGASGASSTSSPTTSGGAISVSA